VVDPEGVESISKVKQHLVGTLLRCDFASLGRKESLYMALSVLSGMRISNLPASSHFLCISIRRLEIQKYVESTTQEFTHSMVASISMLLSGRANTSNIIYEFTMLLLGARPVCTSHVS
jgi:hypothetical protein